MKPNTKNPYIGAFLVFLFGPLGFIYYSWKKSLLAFLLVLLPSPILTTLEETAINVFITGMKISMAIFAFFDLSGKINKLFEVCFRWFSILVGPIMAFLNVLVLLVSVPFLLLQGQWKLLIGAFIFAFLFL